MQYNKQVDKELYLTKYYLNIGRWNSYWHQINFIINLKDIKSILEVGPGNNIIKNILSQLNYDIKTIDIADDINPDFIDDIVNPKIINNLRFDLVLACQVLEHIKYNDFIKAINNLKNISTKYLVISLPIFDKFYFKFNLEFLFIKIKKQFFFNFPFSRPKHQFTDEHYWEIGKKGYELKKVREDILSQGLKIRNEFRPFEKNNHYFFILEK